MKLKKKMLLEVAPEAGVIAGAMAGYYLLDIPVWGLGLISFAVLAGKISWQSLTK